MAKEGKVVGNIERSQPTTVPSRWVSPFDDIERLFDDFFASSMLRPGRLQRLIRPELHAFEGRIPHVDVIDRGNEVLVRAELPGVDKQDLDVSLSENTITIKASSSHEREEEQGDYHRREISRGSFARTIPLPAMVVGDEAKASFKDGILEMTLPKIEQSKRRRIEIQ